MPTPEPHPDDTRSSRRLGPAGWIALIVLFGLLGATVWYAIYAWSQLGDVGISGMGWFFLVMGVIVTTAVGAGLMGLVFYSSRKGKDF
jgi:hypothetical protein